ACANSFAFFSSSPLVVQQPPTHRLLVVIPVRRECCSWRCDSSARATYFTAPTSTTTDPAHAGVDYVEARGAVLFEVGQQRAQLARAFAVVLEAPANASTLLRASTEIVVEQTQPSKSTSV
ncbi:hypothetical protein PHYSODRAFT_450315, partial [Phytophthora sojae]